MRIRAWIAIAAGIAAATPALAQQAPFCVATNSGTQCFYYTVDACRQAAASMRGMCTVNPQQQAAQRAPYDIAGALKGPDIMQSSIQAAEAGARAGQARAEHESRMRLIEAQIQAQRQPQNRPAVQIVHKLNVVTGAMYRCTGADGAVSYSTTPEVGCVVFMVTK